MTVDARARLLRGVLAFGEGLVFEHVGMPTLCAEVHREGIARPDRLQAGIFLQSRLRDDRTRIGPGRRARHRLAAAEARALLVHGAAVSVVLEREVPAPGRGVFGLVGELHHAKERVPRLLLALEDVDEQGGDHSHPDGSGERGEHDQAGNACLSHVSEGGRRYDDS
jgi:hypothetical protein